MVGRQLVALKVTNHPLKRTMYLSHSYNPLASQEGVIIVDTEMVPEEKKQPWKASAEHLLCGQ